MIDPGELNRLVVLRVWTDVANAGFGVDQIFDAGVSVWAKVEPVHGLALRAGMNTGEVPTHLFWLRQNSGRAAEDVTQSQVFEWKSRRYRVLDAINVDDGRQWIRVTCKDLGAFS